MPRLFSHPSPLPQPRFGGAEYAFPIAPSQLHTAWCMETFQQVATIINLYKVARYAWEAAEDDTTMPADAKLEKQTDLEAAQSDLVEIIDVMEDLPPASRQQLHILYYETQIKDLTLSLQTKSLKRERIYDFADEEDDNDRPFLFGGDVDFPESTLSLSPPSPASSDLGSELSLSPASSDSDSSPSPASSDSDSSPSPPSSD
ncbi:hypothetical protein NMY22_g12538 [Coprinellus aureogranulatus]|nr:hypothetical protein NMY22_g12538 [Coprinellus aureogranulatus]